MQRHVVLTLSSFGLLLMVAAAGNIAIRNYRAIRGLFAADPPARILQDPYMTAVPRLQEATFGSGPGSRIAAWYVPPREVPGPAVVVATGTNGDRSTLLPEIRLLAAAGFGVVAFDWPGLGHSEGPVRWDSPARRALTAAVDWLSVRGEINPARIGGLGFSIGGYVMTQVAATDPRLRAVVLEATPSDYDTYLDVHNAKWGWISKWPARAALSGSGLLDPQVAPVNLIAEISPRPVLLLAMSEDPEVPLSMVVKLYESARQPKSLWVLPGATHGGYMKAEPEEYSRRILAFFSASLTSERPAKIVP